MYSIRFKWLYVVGFVFVVGLIVGAGIWWKSWGGKQEVASGDGVEVVKDEEVVDDEVVTKETKTSGNGEIDTSDWKTYRNEEYGFEFKYPSDWQLDIDEFKIALYSPSTINNIEKRTTWPGGDIEFIIKESVEDLDYDNREPRSLLEYLTLYKEPANVIDFKEINFNGYKTYEAELAGYGKYYSIFIENPKNIIQILFIRRPDRRSLSQENKKILDSFRIKK